jgi:hypothetical protein
MSAAGRAARTGWKPGSIPERLALSGLALVPVAVAWPRLHAATGLTLICPLRAVTGVPCPFCGGTTAAVALAAGDLGGALAANPLVPVLALAMLVMTVVMAARLGGRLAPSRPLGPAGTRLAVTVTALMCLLSWAWQVHRAGWW